MSDFLQAILQRHTGEIGDRLRPRLPSRFESPAASIGPTGESDIASPAERYSDGPPPRTKVEAWPMKRQHSLSPDAESADRATVMEAQSPSPIDLNWQQRLTAAEAELRRLREAPLSSPHSLSASPWVASEAMPREVPSGVSAHESFSSASKQSVVPALRLPDKPSTQPAVSAHQPGKPILERHVHITREVQPLDDASLKTPPPSSVGQPVQPRVHSTRAPAVPRIAVERPSNVATQSTVHISIGRIEVRGPAPSEPKRPERPMPGPKIMTLDEYIQKRRGGMA